MTARSDDESRPEPTSRRLFSWLNAQTATLCNRYRRNLGTARLMRGMGTFGFSVRASATDCQSREGGKGQDGGSGGGPVCSWITGGARTNRTTAERKAATLRCWPAAALRLPRWPARKPPIVPALGLGRPARVRTAAPSASDIHRRRRASVQVLWAATPEDRRRSGRRRAPRSG